MKLDFVRFVHANVTTHIAASEITVFETTTVHWYIPQTSCLFMKDTLMVHCYSSMQTPDVLFVHEG